jgi:hypothetical protein
MGRRLAAGVAGTSGLGTLSVTSSTISTTTTNGDLTLDPNGSGGVLVVGDLTITDQSDLRLRESSGNGTNYLAMQAAANMAANYTITWPSAVAAGAGYYLASDTNGTLSWSAFPTAGLTTSDPGASATVHYPLFETNSGSVPSGSVSTLKARSNLTFVPSTGELFSSVGHHPNIYGSTSSSGTITIRGTSNATKASASVLMTDAVTSNSTSTGTLVVTGGVGISGQMTATTIVETSSIAFKENINPIENALNLIMQLDGVTYDRKDNREHEAGLIAEKVYTVAPDLVSLDANGKPYGIKYTKLGAYLLEAIKEINLKLEDFRNSR